MCSNRPAASLYMNRKRRSKSNRRKTRSKTKKPKFLSLRRKFPAEETKEIEELSGRKSLKDAAEDIDGYELKLFPQQPENLVEDRESYDHENENVAVFFSAGDSSATTLTGLLDFSADHQSNSSLTVANNHNITSRYRSYSCLLNFLFTKSINECVYLIDPIPTGFRLRDLSPSAAYSEDPSPLVRNAFRSRERDAREETWVSLSEVVKEEEVSSSGGVGIQGLRLKLDYEEIIDAWSNKGSLYIDAETPQIVPDINHQFMWQQSSNNQVNI